MSYFVRNGIRFHYSDSGAGPPLVLSHAIGRDLSQVQRYIGSPPHFRVVSWDARGHGRTEPIGPPDQLNFESFAEDLAALLDHLEIEAAILGGISMGAATSMAFCSRWPSRVRAAILIRPAWLVEPNPHSLQIIALIGRLLSEYSPNQARTLLLQTDEYRELRTISVAAANQILSELDHPLGVTRAVPFVHMPASAPINDWRELEQCKMPVLVVGCLNDPFHPVEVSQTWVEKLPNARFEIVASPIEEPDQHVYQLRQVIADFLTTV
jgi:pimeloyl-ACP methyl ester carboxylesterase